MNTINDGMGCDYTKITMLNHPVPCYRDKYWWPAKVVSVAPCRFTNSCTESRFEDCVEHQAIVAIRRSSSPETLQVRACVVAGAAIWE